MKLTLNITSITKVTDDKLLVQLQGEQGTAQLNLPLNQQAALQVGQEYTLSPSITAASERYEAGLAALTGGVLKRAPGAIRDNPPVAPLSSLLAPKPKT